MRENFPAAGTEYLGGQSDGYVYQSLFGGTSLAVSYEMVRLFLAEEGYADVPVPETVEDLLRFRLPVRNKQILMFEDNGYVHNPVKILFLPDRRKKNTLLLEIYNEKAPRHLLRFHNKLTERELEALDALAKAEATRPESLPTEE